MSYKNRRELKEHIALLKAEIADNPISQLRNPSQGYSSGNNIIKYLENPFISQLTLMGTEKGLNAVGKRFIKNNLLRTVVIGASVFLITSYLNSLQTKKKSI